MAWNPSVGPAWSTPLSHSAAWTPGRVEKTLALAVAITVSSSVTLEVRQSLALALGLQWEQVTDLQAVLKTNLAASGIDAIVETHLQSTSFLHLDPTHLGWDAQMTLQLPEQLALDLDPVNLGWVSETILVLIEQAVEYIDLETLQIDWETALAIMKTALADFAMNIGWDSSSSLSAMMMLNLSQMWSAESSAGLGIKRALPLGSTGMTWTPATTLMTMFGISLSQTWSFGLTTSLLARYLLSLNGRSITWGISTTVIAERLMALATRSISFGSTCTLELIYSHAPESYSYTTAGSYSLTVESWMRYFDVVCLGGGASGQTGHGGINAAGQGGNAGVWSSTTWEKGVDFTGSSLSITVGAGGPQPANSDHAASQPGSASVVTVDAKTNSGAGGTGNNYNNQTGLGPGNHTYLGTTYTGGANTTTSGNAVPGNAPGGGGRGGNGGLFGFRTRGGVGATGRVWIVARPS